MPSLRTSEPNAAEWISRTLGGVEIERLKESRSSGQLGNQCKTTSHNNERQMEPLVMDSEISGLANLHGYLKCENLVVRMSFPIIALPSRHPGYIQRPIEIQPEELQVATAVAAATSGTLEQKLKSHEISRKIRGEWHGKLAEQWGLRGNVSEEHFQRLGEGQHPITGEQLVRHKTNLIMARAYKALEPAQEPSRVLEVIQSQRHGFMPSQAAGEQQC